MRHSWTWAAVGVIALFAADALGKPVSVKPYVRKSTGAHVQRSHRSSPNGTTGDNYGAKGSINPFTGKAGMKRNSK